MAKRFPWHSAQAGQRVYHDNDECPDGTTIDYSWLRRGAADWPLCRRCHRLDSRRTAPKPGPLPWDPEDDLVGVA